MLVLSLFVSVVVKFRVVGGILRVCISAHCGVDAAHRNGDEPSDAEEHEESEDRRPDKVGFDALGDGRELARRQVEAADAVAAGLGDEERLRASALVGLRLAHCGLSTAGCVASTSTSMGGALSDASESDASATSGLANFVVRPSCNGRRAGRGGGGPTIY